jgi:transposase
VFALDEARFGLKVRFRRRWCPFGARPPFVHQDRYEWLWLYVAVEPVSGASIVLFLPRLDGVCFEAFLAAFRRAVPAGRIGLVLDGAGSHGSGRVRWPAELEPIALPRYSPELNPAERWFEQLRATLANRVFASLADLEAALTEALEPYWEEPDKLARLTAYPWWRKAVQQIATP